MKKLLIILTLLFPIFLQAQLIDQISISFEEIKFTKQDGFDRIKYGMDYLQEPGKPELPVITRSFVIPTNAEVSGIDVEITGERKVEGSFYLYPVQPFQITDGTRIGFLEPDSTYRLSTVFPGNAAILSSDGIIQGYHVITISYYPVRYIPSAGELYLLDLSVTVNYQTERNTTQQVKSSHNRSMLSKAYVKSMVQNLEDVDLYYDESAVIPPSDVMDRFSGGQKGRSLNALGETVPDYIIITCDSLKETYKRLADWKTKKGVPAVIKTVEEIGISYSGSDLAEKIRNYLTDAKKRWGNGLFVLLGGDTNIIPARMVFGEYKSLYPADSYFEADVVNDWNPVNNTFNSNFNTSFYLGRLPLQKVKETEAFINKLLEYERANTEGVNYSYFKNSLIVDGFGTINRGQGINKDETYFYNGQMTNLYNYCQNRASDHNYWYLFDHAGCTDPKHNHNDPGRYDTSKTEELSKNSFLSAWSNGKTFGKFHFVYHLDHSMQANMGTSSTDKGNHITNEDVDNIPDDKYPKVIMSAGCHPARFSKDCIAEHFLKKTYGGAVAFIGNTDVGYFIEAKQLDNFLKAAFEKKSANIKQFSIGYLFRKASDSYISRKWKLHLLGDPEMPVWTTTPKELQVIKTTQLMSDGAMKITVRVTNLPVGEQALICLMKGDEGYATRIVNDTEPVSISFNPMTMGIIDLTVTAHNFKPYESTIPVMMNPNPNVQISEINFVDRKTATTNGNGDGQLDAGETVELIVKLSNRSTQSVNIDYARIFCSRPDLVTIWNNEVKFGVIDPGQEVQGKTRFRFQVSNDIGGTEILKNDSVNIRFLLKAYHNINCCTDSFKVDVFAGKPELQGQTLRSGPIAGVTRIDIRLTNTGKATLTGLKGELVPYGTGGFVESCPNNNTTFPDISPGQTVINESMLTFIKKAGYTSGNPLKMMLKLTNLYGYTWELPLDPMDTPPIVSLEGITVQSNGHGVRLCWLKSDKADTYNVYRSQTGASGSYLKVNSRPLNYTYFQDEDFQLLSTYYYKVEAVSGSGNKAIQSNAIKVMTPSSLVENFPVTTKKRCSAGGIEVEDVDNDGYKEIVVTGTSIGDTNKGFLSIINHQGKELFNEQSGAMNGLGEIVATVNANPSVGNLLGNGTRQIVTTTWKDGFDGNTVNCFIPESTQQNGKADQLWQNVLKSSMYRGAVLANLDNSADGSMETLIKSHDTWTTIKVLDNKGKKINEIGRADRYSRPAVADLDGDGDLEIIVCYDNLFKINNNLKGGGMFIWHHDGTPYKGSPFWGDGISLCSPVICTWSDGNKVAVVAETLNTSSRIFAVYLSGSLAGKTVSQKWGGGITIPYSDALASGLDHMLSVGDINGDKKMEVVSLGINTIKAWDMAGNELFNVNEPQLFENSQWAVNIQTPILADVDGDNIADVVFSSFDRICALRGDGSRIDGFPLFTNMPVREHLCVADVDYDGKNELIAMDTDAQVFMWKTRGLSSGIEWGSERHDPQNTGEYRTVCQSMVIKSSSSWDGITPCGNLIIYDPSRKKPLFRQAFNDPCPLWSHIGSQRRNYFKCKSAGCSRRELDIEEQWQNRAARGRQPDHRPGSYFRQPARKCGINHRDLDKLIIKELSCIACTFSQIQAM